MITERELRKKSISELYELLDNPEMEREKVLEEIRFKQRRLYQQEHPFLYHGKIRGPIRVVP